MAFQPLGYSFEVRSPMQPDEAKAALRSAKMGWFESKNGPRGWIAGPLFCLWTSALDRHGPMVVGWISDDNPGTRIRGRAGADLNGVWLAALILPFLAYGLYHLSQTAAEVTWRHLLLGVLFLVGWPLIFWFGHKDRRTAEPLVNFVRRTLGRDTKPSKPRSSSNTRPGPPAYLNVSGNEQHGAPATPDEVCEAIGVIQFDPNGFLILQREGQHYMQAATQGDGFILEKREGDENLHFVARRSGEDEAPLSAEEVTAAMYAYLEGRAGAVGIRWERLFR